MINALLLMVKPVAAWERILRARRSIALVLVIYLVPLLLLTCLGEGYGLMHWGKRQGEVGRLRLFSLSEAVVVEAGQFLLSVLVVFVGANMIKGIGETFHGRHTYSQAFTTVAYSLGPLFFLRLSDAFTGISPWMSWSVGILLSLMVLYHGVPPMMRPDPTHAFGLYLMSAILLVLVTGMARFVTAAFMQGKFTKLQVIVTHLSQRLPF